MGGDSKGHMKKVIASIFGAILFGFGFTLGRITAPENPDGEAYLEFVGIWLGVILLLALIGLVSHYHIKKDEEKAASEKHQEFLERLLLESATRIEK